MIIDVNAFIGHYPFRKLAARNAEQMIELMDASGIDRAVVSSLHSVFYRDAHRGNEELMEQIQPHGSRFIPVATVNPKYADWRHDLEECVTRWKMKAVTLVPEHHGYSLTDDDGKAALNQIAEYGLPVVLTQRFEDRRQRHHWDVANDLDVATLTTVAEQHPRLKFLLSNWTGLSGTRLAAAGLKGRCLIDFARSHVVLFKSIPRLIETLGVESIAFGSHMPFDYVGPSLVKLANLESLPQADYEKIAWRNAAAFLNVDV
ncbi:amidohydrolase family protein [Fuerstiella marisgermanici]|uniref:Putative metal-dependent hydrolase of the TIM-barrel fold protein n=1 Tax=Fuerstiella marisgermanici TaxID=1891926 RepID=A0A1P8WIP3_9PLAN|nr:amidohydrolase family protein [Fuerstiella marisgermanici]APZ93918.1 putative metal-dependent hydrolase of the TIM-barrel fold protein [Fuerstiella marisgermanici]